MPAKPVSFHPDAVQETIAACDWYRERSRAASSAFLHEVEIAVRWIGTSPQRWPVGPSGTRHFPLRKFPYSVIYVEGEEIIHILAIAHGRRRPGYWKDRS
jgi:toxin ParE1/3/4